MVLNCFGRGGEDEEEAEARRASREIERRIAEWSKPFKQAIKILLLGAGEAGKTTIIKQMKILHISGFSDKERAEQVAEVRRNVHEAMNVLCASMPLLQPPVVFADPSLISYATRVQSYEPPYNQDFYDAVLRLWQDSGVQECFRRSNEFQLIDCAKYFLDRLEELRREDYVPCDQDILHCRKKTSGIQKVEFTIKVPRRHGGGSQSFWMFDVGGQRGERRKWIQAFDGVHAVLFLIGCSSFDQVIREDGETNRLREALNLFEEVWDSRYLRDAGFILFLNKQDVLRQKIEDGHRLEAHFPEFSNYEYKDDGKGDKFERSRAFIRDLFLNVTRTAAPSPLDRRLSVGPGIVMTPEGGPDRPRDCYWHYTTAVDTRNVRMVFEDVHSIIISWNLSAIGLE
ncbi:hypothetical protein B566_EDAN007600 [Ephemera danica]|nr:hypothetical protein B566_EDAN007600 [Ephemera danica]